VFSLHHLEDQVFTYMNTPLSKYHDFAAQPPIFIGFGRTDRTPQLHVTRLCRKLSSVLFEYLVLSKNKCGSKTPEHVNTPLCGINM
jgi:hypothetical protein